MAMNKGLKIALIFASVGVLGVGGYFLFKKLKKKKEQKNEEEESKKRASVTEKEVKSTSYNRRKSPSSSSLGRTPFTDATQGNAFRKWINDNYPKYAKQIDLDATGSYDNAYIRKAWNEYGKDYEDAQEKAGKTKSAVYNVTYGATFKKLLDAWKKSHLLSGRSSTKDVPYFQLFMRPFSMKFTPCLIGVNIYDRKLGENVGGKDGKGYFMVMTKDKSGKWSVVSEGRWSNDLTTLQVTSGRNKGQTYSGGSSVGKKFGEMIGFPDASWC